MVRPPATPCGPWLWNESPVETPPQAVDADHATKSLGGTRGRSRINTVNYGRRACAATTMGA